LCIIKDKPSKIGDKKERGFADDMMQ